MSKKAKYTPRPQGLASIGRKDTIGREPMRAARQIAQIANELDKDGRYIAVPRKVPTGRRRELRSGAAVKQTVNTFRAWKKQTLKTAIKKQRRGHMKEMRIARQNAKDKGIQ